MEVRLLVFISKLRTDAGLPPLILREVFLAGGGVGGRLTVEADTRWFCSRSLFGLPILPVFRVGGGGGALPPLDPSSPTAILLRRKSSNSPRCAFPSSSTLGESLPVSREETFVSVTS